MFYFVCILVLVATCRTGFAQKDPKIVGGQAANISDFPFQLSLNTSLSDCGASIISADWALTAAHCFMESKTNVTLRAGSTYRNWGGSVHNAIDIIVHENFSTKTVDYDIAVVKVSPPFTIGQNNVAAVKLASVEPPAKTHAIVSGFGVTTPLGKTESTTLKAGKMNVRTRLRCKIGATLVGAKFTDRMICAGSMSSTSCYGDSGGPLTSKDSGEQIGIDSFGLLPICVPFVCDYYTNVANLRDWIKAKTGV